jgi:hypothetical protein
VLKLLLSVRSDQAVELPALVCHHPAVGAKAGEQQRIRWLSAGSTKQVNKQTDIQVVAAGQGC